MKLRLSSTILTILLGMSTFASAKGPEVDLVDNKLSINVEAISLSRLLRLFDLATGMKSKVPPELANRNMSVKFSGLNLTDGVKKIFQGQPLDYVVIQGQGIVITAASQSNGSESAPAYNPPQQIDQPFNQSLNPQFNQDFPPGTQPQPGQLQQPPMVQTPFGPMANPRAGQPVQPNVQQVPQQNSLFPTSTPTPPGQQQQGQPGFPGGQQPNNPTPFGTPNPFGAPPPPANNPNNLFGAPVIANPSQRTP